jgi:hypothetical protein
MRTKKLIISRQIYCVLVISKVLRMQHLNISSHPGVQYVQRAQTFCSTLTDIVAISAAESGLAVARDPEVDP